MSTDSVIKKTAFNWSNVTSALAASSSQNYFDIPDDEGGYSNSNYVTHFEEIVTEATTEEEKPPERAPSREQLPVAKEPPKKDLSQSKSNLVPADGEMLPEEEPLTSPKEVGRIYELKKIHSRLIAIQSFLSTTVDKRIYKLRSYISKSIDLFNTLISNVDLYKEKLDEIIVFYYKFIQSAYAVLQKHLKKGDSE